MLPDIEIDNLQKFKVPSLTLPGPTVPNFDSYFSHFKMLLLCMIVPSSIFTSSFMLKLTEINEESSIALSLVMWHGHDTADIILLGAVFLLRKIPYQVTSFGIILKKIES